jgi:pimeloyl-ACP methyl ester carboxylesterase
VFVRAIGFGGPRAWVQVPEAELRELRVPALVVSGTDDTHGGPVLARRLGSLWPHASVEILNDAGHTLWLDDREAVAAAMRRFCTAQAPQRLTV